MAISTEIHNLLSKERFDEVEDHWLTQTAERPEDVDYFLGVARAMGGVGEDQRARLLLAMYNEQLETDGRHRTRLELLRKAGPLWLETEEIHPAILETLEAIHGDTPSFAGFVQAVRLDKAPHDLKKTWEKVERLEGLVPFDVGAVVWMEGKGAGRVAEVNLGLDSLKVDFDKHPGLTVGFRAAAKLLQVLGTDHILRRRMEDPETLKAIGEESPPELLRIVLQSYDRPLAAGDVRENLEGIVPKSRWTSWWAAARKHPQVVAGSKGRQTYRWLASSEDAKDAVWTRFERASPRDRLALLGKEGDRDPDLARRMVEALREQAHQALEDDQPGLAFETWYALDRRGQAADNLPWSPRALIGEAGQIQGLLSEVEDRSARERAHELVRELREDWTDVWTTALTKEEDAKLLNQLAAGLIDTEPTGLWRFVDDVLGQPHKYPPAFAWVVERAADDPTFRDRSPLRLLQQLFTVILDKRFTPLRPRLLPHLESGGTAPRLLDHLTEPQAASAAEAIGRAAGLEPYQREALGNALKLRFPNLDQEEEDELIYSTPDAIAARREELRVLVREELPANRKAIEEARALGDLRENFEYKSARQRHEYLSSRQAQLENELARVRPIDASKIDASEVRIGTRVELSGDGETRSYTLLGPWDSKPEEGILAYASDLAQSLLGKTRGERVEIQGKGFEITAIRPYTDG